MNKVDANFISSDNLKLKLIDSTSSDEAEVDEVFEGGAANIGEDDYDVPITKWY